MPGKIDVYNLGTKGINVTKSPAHTEDGELVQAQNSIPDPRGQFGALTKRDGLGEITASSLGGAIQAIALIPFPGTPVALSSTGAIPPTGDPTLEIFLGIVDTVTAGDDWVMSTDSWATSATLSGTALLPSTATVTGRFNDSSFLGHGISTSKQFIYPGKYVNYVQGSSSATDAPPILLWDGVRTDELVRITPNSALNTNDPTHYPLPVNCKYIYDMILSGTTIYLIAHDEPHDAGGLTYYSRVLTFDLLSNALVEMNTHFDIASVILTAMGVHQNKLFIGLGEGLSGLGATGQIYRDNLDGTWKLDKTLAVSETPLCMASFNGNLYIGTELNTANPAKLYQRDPLGAYTTSTTTAASASDAGSRFGAMIVFQNNLYAAFYNLNGGASSSGIMQYTGSAWSIVKTVVSGVANPAVHGVAAYVLNGIMYFVFNDAFNNHASLQYSPDGVTWTSVTTNLTPSKYISSIMGGIVI